MRKIAIEEHLIIPEFAAISKEIDERLAFPNFFPASIKKRLVSDPRIWSIEARLADMDKYGIDTQVLSAVAPVQNDLDELRAAKTAARCNDILYELTQKHPTRFKAFGNLALQNPADAIIEAERCVKELGFVGFMVNGATNFHYYDEPLFYPVWAKLEELGVPLYLHVASPAADQIRIFDGFPELLGTTWVSGVDAATHALRIICSGIFDRFPGAKLILGHMGEGLPYLLDHTDEGFALQRELSPGHAQQLPSYYMKRNLYISTSCGFGAETMACAIGALGADHILFACDYPNYELDDSMKHMASCSLTHTQESLIYHSNAERILKI